MPNTILTNRIRRKSVVVSSAHAQLVRQWQLLEWLSSAPGGVTVTEAAEATGVNDKTIRRDLIMLRKIGFHLEGTVEERGRKRWRVRRPFERLRSKRRKYKAIRGGLDMLLEQAAQVGDGRLVDDLRAIRRRVVRKAK